MDNETPPVTSMVDRKDTDDSIVSTEGNEKDGTTLDENKVTPNKLESEEIDKLIRTIRIACFDKDWKQVGDFLSNMSISNNKKNSVFQDGNSDNCRHALLHGACLPNF